ASGPPPHWAASPEGGPWSARYARLRRNVTLHPEAQRHVVEDLAWARRPHDPPGLILVPRIQGPFAGSLDVVVGEVIVEKAVPIRDGHADGEIVDHLLDVEVLFYEFP